MRYYSTWLRPLLYDIKKLVIEEIATRVFHCIQYVHDMSVFIYIN